MRKMFALLLVLCMALSLGTCALASGGPSGESSSASEPTVLTAQNEDGTYPVEFDNSCWSYDADNDVWYQIGVVYCAEPDTLTYETFGIYVPGAYLNGTDNGDGTYTCTVNADGEAAGYTAATAPILLPMNTPGYSAQSAPTSYKYSTCSSYVEAGFVYVSAGCRGRNNGDGFDGGAPWGVTDIKAAIRYLRYNSDVLPGNTEYVFVDGHSGGGAQTALVGTSGNSELYTPYLESIGACMTYDDGTAISDAIYGAMCWCPITSLNIADEAYEWNMGQYMTTGTRADDTWTSALSDDLAAAYADIVNNLGLVDADGNALTLEESEEGIYAAGSYYDYMVSEINRSLNNYIADNGLDGAEYVAELNADEEWVSWDGETASVASIDAFARHIKNASKSVCAFDDLNRGQAENYVFGDNENDVLHFDAIVAELLADNADEYAAYADYSDTYAEEYTEYLQSTDALGTDSLTRQDMYNPMYYISAAYDGYGTTDVAPNWRIHTGITQGDTSLCVEMNLYLALQAYGVDSMDFEMVWAQGHTQAERTGKSTANYIAWINDILGAGTAEDSASSEASGEASSEVSAAQDAPAAQTVAAGAESNGGWPLTGSGDTSMDAYKSYLKAYMDCVPEMDGHQDELYELIDQEAFDDPPVCMAFEDQFEANAMTYDEFVAANGEYSLQAFGLTNPANGEPT